MFKFIIQFLLINNFLQFAYSTGETPSKSNPPGQIDQNQGQTRHRNLLPLPGQLPVLNSSEAATNLSHPSSGDSTGEGFVDKFEVPILSAFVAENAPAVSFPFSSPPLPSSFFMDSKGKAIVDYSPSSAGRKGKEVEVIEIEEEDEPRIGENMPKMHQNQAEQMDPALEPYLKEIARLNAQIGEVEKNMKEVDNLHSTMVPDEVKNVDPYRPDLEWDYVVEGYELQLPFLKQILPLKRNIVEIFEEMIAKFPSNPQLTEQKKLANFDATVLGLRIKDRENFCEDHRQTQNNQRGQQRQGQAAIEIQQAAQEDSHQRINPTYANAPGINIANNPPNQQIHLHGSLGRQMAAALIAQKHHQRHQPMHGPMEQKQMRRQPSIMPNQIPGMHSSNMGGTGGSSSSAGGIIAQIQHAAGHQGHQLPPRSPLSSRGAPAAAVQDRRLRAGGAMMSLLEQSRKNLQHIPLEILRAEMARRESQMEMQMQMENSGGGSSSVERGNIPGGSSGNAAAQFRLPPPPNFHQHPQQHFARFTTVHHIQQQIQMPSVDVQWNQFHSIAHPHQNLSNHPSDGGSDGQQQGPSGQSNFNGMTEGSNGNKRMHEQIGDGEDDERNKRMQLPHF